MTWETTLDPTFSARLCLTLAHSLWQMTLLALVVWGLDRLCVDSSGSGTFFGWKAPPIRRGQQPKKVPDPLNLRTSRDGLVNGYVPRSRFGLRIIRAHRSERQLTDLRAHSAAPR